MVPVYDCRAERTVTEVFATEKPDEGSQPGGLTRPDEEPTGRELYMQACAACHGADGTGAPPSQRGFETPMPDFTDCNFASREPDADWVAVAHEGGPVRGFSRMMPAFGDALSVEELRKVMDYVRTLCGSEAWPRGELNLPRPLVTEKAYPEDEAVLSTSIDAAGSGAVMNELVYEKRYGVRGQLEVVVPFGWLERGGGEWTQPRFGDLAVGWKHVLTHGLESGHILSFTGEVIWPTGARTSGFGGGTTLLEPFLSYGQLLPAGSFLHAQGGTEIPLDQQMGENEAFLRAAFGKSVARGRWGRTFSPMVEVLASGELEPGAPIHWDLVPQMQVTLNTRQHVMANVGVRLPADGSGRDPQVMVYLLWDWFDGGFLEGW